MAAPLSEMHDREIIDQFTRQADAFAEKQVCPEGMGDKSRGIGQEKVKSECRVRKGL
jgi:hypothetical protein